MDLGLQGAKVLVTAASEGLGAATALQFALEGAQVVISSRNLEKLQKTAAEINEQSGAAVFTIAADVTDIEATQKMVRNAAEMLGGLDIVVTNAGGPPAGVFTNFDLQNWQEATQLTLLSAVNIIRETLPYLRQSKRAAILTITSIAAKQPVDNLTLSNAIRPAVVGLTKTLSQELGPEGIRVNSILPGITDTSRVKHLMQTRAKKNGTTVDEEYQRASANIPLRRIGQPDEFARAAVFLCSPAASFITGVALTVDGGATKSIF
ncbi:MAG: SDR family oxidoreductase [Chloroflexi bacterium]|nr:MAG: SDR family oxidoreductase [Chloroflexota bacterium]